MNAQTAMNRHIVSDNAQHPGQLDYSTAPTVQMKQRNVVSV